MEYTLSITEAAEEDIKQAFLWYEEQKTSLGERFEAKIFKAMAFIQKKPLFKQIRYDDIRIYFLKKFPYGIHYKVSTNQILVVAVFHAARSPLKWLARKPK